MAGQRQVDPAPLAMQPGMLLERSPRAAKGRYIAGDNVRWYEGLPQKTGGCLEQPLYDPNDETQPILYKGFARAVHEWDSLDGQNWVAIGTHTKLYVVNNGFLYDITPIRRTATLSAPFTTTVGSTRVQVSDPGHEAEAGAHVRFTKATAVGGITLNGEYEVIDAPDGDLYFVQHVVPATSSAVGGGTPNAEYDINPGLESDGVLDGFGTGDYGEEEYGTPRTSSTFGGFARVWSLDNWGEDLLASPNGETLYWWQKRTGPQSRAVVRLSAPPNIEFMVVGPDDRHVLAFGTNVLGSDGGVDGEQDKMFVRWCVGDNFDDWIVTEGNDAGSKRLDIGSRIITVIKTRTQIVIWTDKQLYGLSFVAGQDVYEILPLGRCQQIISKNAAVDLDGVVYFMGLSDFYKFDGTLQPIQCDIKDFVFPLNKAMASKVHAHVHREFNEIRWHFTSLDNDENDQVAVYNYQFNCWYPCSIARECALDTNAFYRVPLGFAEGAMFLHETGTDLEEDDPMVAYLESWEYEISSTSHLNQYAMTGGADALLLQSMIPDFTTLVGSIDLNVFGREYPHDDRENSDVQVITAATKICEDVRFRKKQMGFRVESHELGDAWRMDEWRINAGSYGRRG